MCYGMFSRTTFSGNRNIQPTEHKHKIKYSNSQLKLIFAHRKRNKFPKSRIFNYCKDTRTIENVLIFQLKIHLCGYHYFYDGYESGLTASICIYLIIFMFTFNTCRLKDHKTILFNHQIISFVRSYFKGNKNLLEFICDANLFIHDKIIFIIYNL